MKLKKIFKGIVAALATLLVVSVAAGVIPQKAHAAANNSSVSAIKKRGTIKIAVFGDLQPYGWVTKSGKRTGYDVYLARRIGKDLGVKVKFVQVNADSRVDALNSNKVDLVLANFTVTGDRKKQVSFAKPYMKVSIGIVSPKKKAVTNVSQLKGKKVIVTKGTTAETYFTKHPNGITLQKYDSKTQQFNALKNGRAAALADDNSYLFAWVKKHPSYKVGVKNFGPSQNIAPGIKKGNKSLTNWTNKEITKLNKEGFFQKDYNKNLKPYFGSDIKASDIIITNNK